MLTAARHWRRHRAFGIQVVFLLAIAIGVSAAVLSIVEQLLVDPVPFADGRRIVLLWNVRRSDSLRAMPTIESVQRVRANARSFRSVEAIEPTPLTLAGADFPETVNGQRINASLPRFLGVSPLLGRPFLAEEIASAQPVALISESVWHNRYGGRRDVIGQSIRVDGTSRQIVGVLPDIMNRPLGAFFVKTDGVWLPIDEGSSPTPGRRGVWALARLAPGTSLATARQELLDLSTRLRETDASYGDWLITVTPLTALVQESTRTMLYLLLAAIVIILVIATANLSHLSLAHASARTHEMAVRSALGASKRQVWGQVFIEACIHVASSTVVGVLLGAAVIKVLVLIRPRDLNEVEVVGLTWRVLALCLILSAAMVLAGFCVPMLRGARRGGSVAHVLRTGSSTLLSMSAPRRAALIASETCLAFILLLTTGILVGRLQAVSRIDPGFAPGRLVSATVNLPRGRYPSLASAAVFVDRLVERVRAVPGVEAATIGLATPPTYATAFGRIEWEGRVRASSDTVGATRAENRVRPEYFRIVGARLTAGRFFAEGETGVAVINAAMASYFWGPTSPIGRRFRVGDGAWQTVVGIVQDMQVGPHIGAPGFQVHAPASTVPPARVLVLRTASDPASVLPSIRAAIAELDPDVTLRRVARVEDELKSLSAQLRFVMLVVASLAALAVVLAAMGVFAIISYSVALSATAVGIRRALGASERRVVLVFVRQVVVPMGFGIMIGVVVTAAAAPLTRALLSEIPTLSVGIVSVSALLLLAVCAIALWTPIWRLVGASPADALHIR